MQLELSQLTKTYGGQEVLNIPEFSCSFTHCLALIGPSGGGKSTLLRLIGGLERQDAGRIVIDDREVPSAAAGLLAHRRSIGTVFQSFNLFPHLTALANITLPLTQVHGISPGEAAKTASQLLARFGLAAHGNKRPSELSGGQRQRVAIARAVAIRPSFFLMDEPTSALDPEMTAEILGLLDELRTEERPLVLVTHEIGFARHAADYIAFLSGGNVSAHAPAADFFQNPPTEEVRQFLSKTLRFSTQAPEAPRE